MPNDPSADALSKVLRARYSCRAFLPKPVPQNVLEAIVQDAGHAPSWCNAQPWQVTLTVGARTDLFRAALMDTAQSASPNPDLPWPEGYPGATGERRRECGFQLYEAVGIGRDDKPARMANYVINLRKELLQLAHVCGVQHPALISPDQCEILDERFSSQTARHVFGILEGTSWGMPSCDQAEQITEIMKAG